MIVKIPPLSMRFTATNGQGQQEHFDLVLPALELDPDLALKVMERINYSAFSSVLKQERYICYAVGIPQFMGCIEISLEADTVGVWLNYRAHPSYGFSFGWLYPERLAWAKHISQHIGIHFQSFPHNADIPKE